MSFSEESFPWLQENHLTSTKSIDDFRPHANISRGEAAKFLTNFALSMQLEKNQDTCSFTDTAAYDFSLRGYTVEACQYGLFRGANGKFSPYNNITEAQALAVI